MQALKSRGWIVGLITLGLITAMCFFTAQNAHAETATGESTAPTATQPTTDTDQITGWTDDDQMYYRENGALVKGCLLYTSPDGQKLVARGEVEGHIVLEEKGPNGFGYDPLFVPVGYDITFGQFDPNEKNKISHRANALKELKKQLKEKQQIK